MLYGRQRELRELSSAWARVEGGRPQLAVVWGRRRVGKTFLLSEFTRTLPTVYFTATRNDTESDQLRRLHEAAQRTLGERIALAGGGFADLEAALRFFVQLAVESPLVLVIDEAPRLAHARRDFGDVLAAVWDTLPARCHLLVVVCGSVVAAMRDLIGPDGGLYRRADPELRVDPLDPWEAAALIGTDDGVTAVEAYAACGGYPLHLAAWNPSDTTDANLMRLAGSPGGILLRDALDIMFEDLDFRSGYERVLATMGTGPTRRSKIAGRAQQRIDHTLTQLQRSGYVTAERPIGSAPTADPLYRLVDPYLRYWFAVLRQDAELIDGGQGHTVMNRVRPRWDAHVQAVFEEIARTDAARRVATGDLPNGIIGRWWLDERREIDVVGLDPDNRAVLLGEVKWQIAPFTTSQLTQLRSAATLVPLAPQLTFGIWTRNGVHPEVAAFPDVRTFTPDTMFSPANAP